MKNDEALKAAKKAEAFFAMGLQEVTKLREKLEAVSTTPTSRKGPLTPQQIAAGLEKRNRTRFRK